MGRKALDLKGKRFGRLFVSERAEVKDTHDSYWKCKCDCGNEKIITGSALKGGYTLSCGCQSK